MIHPDKLKAALLLVGKPKGKGAEEGPEEDESSESEGSYDGSDCASRMYDALEKKDKKAFVAAVKELVAEDKEADKKQHEEEDSEEGSSY